MTSPSRIASMLISGLPWPARCPATAKLPIAPDLTAIDELAVAQGTVPGEVEKVTAAPRPAPEKGKKQGNDSYSSFY